MTDSKWTELQHGKLITLKDFKEQGYLQEANRRFFHLLGLNMLVATDDKGEQVVFLGIEDNRAGKNGHIFEPGLPQQKHVDFVDKEMKKRETGRAQAFGGAPQQPIDWDPTKNEAPTKVASS